MASNIVTSLKDGLITSVLFVIGVVLLFCGLVAPLALRATLRLGEGWAFVLSTLLFATLYFLAELRQRRLVSAEIASLRFTSLLSLIWRRRLSAVFVSGLLLVGTILHGIFVGTGLLDLR